MTTIKTESITAVILGLLLTASLLVYTMNRNKHQDQEIGQINEVIVSMIAKAETSSVVRTDTSGRVISLNDVASRELDLKVGDHLNQCMTAAMGVSHDQIYAASMRDHAVGRSGSTDVVCEARAPDGKLHQVRVQAWTQAGGAAAFITRMPTQDAADPDQTEPSGRAL